MIRTLCAKQAKGGSLAYFPTYLWHFSRSRLTLYFSSFFACQIIVSITIVASQEWERLGFLTNFSSNIEVFACTNLDS